MPSRLAAVKPTSAVHHFYIFDLKEMKNVQWRFRYITANNTAFSVYTVISTLDSQIKKLDAQKLIV